MKQGKWICYPGDFAISLAEKVQTRRYQRNFPIAPFWRVDSAWHNVRFFKTFTATKPQKLHIEWEGRISVFFKRPVLKEDDWYSYEFDGDIDLPAGEHYMEIWVYNPDGLPCIKIDGDELVSDEGILVGNNQIDMYPAEICNCGDRTPNTYALPVRPIEYIRKFEHNGDMVYDFGRLIFAFATLKGEGAYKLYFGETLREALNDTSKINLLAEKPYFGSYKENANEYFCEQIENFTLPKDGVHTSEISKAFRYVRVVGGAHIFSAQEEYDEKGTITKFSSDDELLKKIFDVSLYTYSMCAREFYLDGAKRDRWLWGGDAYEAQKAEYYYQYNAERIKNSIVALFGKSPVKRYVNHIMDYTFYAINMTWEYYLHSGDCKFLTEILPILTEHIEFCLSRRNSSGFLSSEKKDGVFVDWIFVDWGELPCKNGEVSLEQILFWKALRSVEGMYSVVGKNGARYGKIAAELKQKIDDAFWDEQKGAYVFALNDGIKDENFTCHANAFAVLYDFADAKKRHLILENFKNDSIVLSSTPFMIQFVLETLFSTGEFEAGDRMLRSFWGGMVRAGATTFWEMYKGETSEEEATAMYGRPFGRSLCHIWGAGPLFVIPRFYFGIRDDNFGESFVVQPNLKLARGTLTVPLKKGRLTVECKENEVSVFADITDGQLIIGEAVYVVRHGEKTTIRI